MRLKLIILLIVLFVATLFLIPGKKPAHESFIGSPPQPSKPYNITDYTKP